MTCSVAGHASDIHGAGLQVGSIGTPSLPAADVGSLIRARAADLTAAVLAGVGTTQPSGAGVPRAGLRAGDGVGAHGGVRVGRARGGPPRPARAQSGAAAAGVPAARRARRDDAGARSALSRQAGADRRRAGDRRAGSDLQRDARPAGVRAARERSPGFARPGGRAPADRARTARRGRSDTHRRDAPGRGTGRRDPRRAPRPARRAARVRSSGYGGGAPDRTPAAPRGARGPRAAERAGRLAQRSGSRRDSGSSGAWSRAPAIEGTGVGRLPHCAGGAHERRPARGRDRGELHLERANRMRHPDCS